MSDSLQMGQQVLQSQPFSRLLGTQLTVFDGTQAEITLPITPDLLQQHGFVHGGVISYMADNALTFAGGLALGPELSETCIQLLVELQDRWPEAETLPHYPAFGRR